MSCLPNFRSFDRLSQNFPVNILQKLRSKRTYYPLGRVRRLPEEHRYERFHMNRSTSQMRDFARRLMALEAAVNKNSDSKTPATFHVCEKLRPSLATMMGNAGFQALLSYALALAIKEVACLRAVHVNVDGSLEGLVELKEQSGTYYRGQNCFDRPIARTDGCFHWRRFNGAAGMRSMAESVPQQSGFC